MSRFDSLLFRGFVIVAALESDQAPESIRLGLEANKSDTTSLNRQFRWQNR